MTNSKSGKSKKNNNKSNSHDNQGREEAPLAKRSQQCESQARAQTSNATDEALRSFLGREMRVELVDRRVIVGTLVAFMGFGDLLLQTAVEQRCYADGEMCWRPLTLVAIPLKHVTALHRRLPGCQPIALALAEG